MSGYEVVDLSTCTFKAPDGLEYQEFMCRFPILEPLYFWFEKYHKSENVIPYIPTRFWMEQHPEIPIIAVCLYGLFIYAGQKYMEKREPFKWRKGLAAWNLFLTVYSAISVVRGIHPLYNYATLPLQTNLCTDHRTAYGGASGLWVMIFVWSKFAELIDTVFIIAHKKPLLFLHWYHHITVLLYSWFGYISGAPHGPFFGPVNVTVHTVMYGYYFLMAIRMKPKWFNPIYITIFQIAQMIAGVTISCISFYYYLNVPDCFVNKNILLQGLVMYGSYLYLFAAFFVKRYFGKKVESDKKKA